MEKDQINGVQIINLNTFSDERGYLVKVIKKEYVPDTFGEIYVTVAKPGSVKANHYHIKTTEWFYVLKGKCLLLLRERAAKKHIEILLDSNKPQLVKIPPMVEHAIQNVGEDEMFLCVYADMPYDPSDTIKTDLTF